MGITFRWIYLSLCSKNGAIQEERGICVFLSVCINVFITPYLFILWGGSSVEVWSAETATKCPWV